MNEMLSLEKKAEKIEECWQRFIVTGEVNTYIVREVIANSWKRSLEAGVNPYADLQYLVKTQRQEGYKFLITISRPFIDNLYKFVKGSDFMVLLADKEGTILKVLGDQVIEQKLRKLPFKEGENLSELNCGTNCIGLALQENTPVQVSASEHFVKGLQGIVGSAAPFFDSSGNLLGVIAMVGKYKDSHPHTLGMVVASVKAIENSLLYMEANNSLKRSYKEATTIIEEINSGLLSLDANGKITIINTVACSMLGISSDSWVGSNISLLFGEDCVFLEALKCEKELFDEEVTLNFMGGNKRFFSSVRIITDEKGKKLGMIITLRECKAIKRLASKAFGAQATFNFSDIYGQHPSFKKVVSAAQRAAKSENTVLIMGESGTGKEFFAQAIHNSSVRSKSPFVAINCAGIPRELIESELFGYESGAFTGAKKEGRPGKFELAQGGTIFFDEIGDMPIDMQSKLLRVLEDNTVIRLGGYNPISVDARVIVATNRNLYEMVREGSFRLDLFYRINVIALHLPPLRQRETDILLLSRVFLERIAFMKELSFTPVMTKELEKWLLNYSWPGNVRELHNVLEQVIFNAEGEKELCCKHLPEKTFKETASPEDFDEMALKSQEAKHIQQALKICQGNISQSARLLGIGRNTLYRKIRRYNIKVVNVQ